MQNYEITCLVSPELLGEETGKIQEKASSLIQNEGGIIVEIKTAAEKVAFFTSRQKKAISFTMEFQTEPSSIQNIEKKLKDEKEIIRYFIIVKPRFKEMARQRRREIRPAAKETEVKEPKVKVEIAEIEKKLEEILGQ